jgi:hypothetical protein
MKKIVLGAFVLASSFALAQQPSLPVQPKTTQAAPKTPVPPSPAEFDKQMTQVQDNMKKCRIK